MPSRPNIKTENIARDRVFWLAATALVLGQLMAFWMLCSDQVRQAQVRHASVQAERTAVADCLQSAPHATLSSCAAQLAHGHGDAAPMFAARASAGDTVPVNYVYH
jgi:hypothetical protein